MAIRIAFFDIDGTLVEFSERGMRERVRRALSRLQARGTRLFLATGRTPYILPRFEGIEFDGALCFNGGYCFSGSDVIYANPIAAGDVARVVENAKRLGLSTALATAERYGSNFFEPNLEDYMGFSGNTCRVVDDYEQLMREDVYQMMVGATADQDAALIEGAAGVRAARWWDRAVDIIPADSGKAGAMARVLEHYGLRREECAAFGDGGNDMDMIRFAGLGVAMGNAVEPLKAVADYVTDTCENDGVAAAIEHLKLI